MKPEIKELWVEALRSGKYIQGTGQLRIADEKHCCLGVLTEICPIVDINNYAEEGFLPNEVLTWSGINTAEGQYNISNCLTVDNDNGKSFKEIADIIEKHF